VTRDVVFDSLAIFSSGFLYGRCPWVFRRTATAAVLFLCMFLIAERQEEREGAKEGGGREKKVVIFGKPDKKSPKRKVGRDPKSRSSHKTTKTFCIN